MKVAQHYVYMYLIQLKNYYDKIYIICILPLENNCIQLNTHMYTCKGKMRNLKSSIDFNKVNILVMIIYTLS